MRSIFMKAILATKKFKKYKNLHGHAEGWAGVASLAVFECEIAAEGSLSIVTRQARRAARRDEMFCRGGRAYLPCLRGAGS